MHVQTYKPKSFPLSGLNGISDKTLDMHFKLYEGYVKETNTLTEKIAEFLQKGHVDQQEVPAYSELKRRLGFEYNGMVLHDYYFSNLKKQGGGDPDRQSGFHKAVEASYGTYETWKNDFVSVGKMRGVGWAICEQDPETGFVSNQWITMHEVGSVAGFRPLLVMDVWEHAFLLDYKPSERGKYIEAFLSNVDWSAVNARVRADVMTTTGASSSRR